MNVIGKIANLNHTEQCYATAWLKSVLLAGEIALSWAFMAVRIHND